MEIKEYDQFEKDVIKELRKKYKVDSYLKVVKNIIKITTLKLEKLIDEKESITEWKIN